ncbi:MAG: hypothetical protein ABSG15_02600, partial [FCB group bacterium]
MKKILIRIIPSFQSSCFGTYHDCSQAGAWEQVLKKLFIIMILLCGGFHSLRAEYKVGDTTSFWSVSYIDWYSGNYPKQDHIPAVCKKVGEQCYVFIEKKYVDSIPQSTIDYYAGQFDTVYYPRLTPLYGPVPDMLDHDPRVFLFVTYNDWWSGYEDPTSELPDTMTMRIWGVHSNEHEMLYFSTIWFKPENVCAVAHEFGHLLHWGQDHSPEPPDKPVKYWEDTWVDEGFSTFAQDYLCSDINQKDVPDNGFFSV